MRATRAVGAVVVLCAFGLLAAPVAARGPSGQASAAAAKAAHERVVAFWTPERMRAAKPLDMVVRAPEVQSGRSNPMPQAKPSGGAAATTVTVGGASWTKGGLVLHASGVVFFALGTGLYICSGSAVNDTDTNTSLVLTAGHCVYDFSTGWATNWMFIPEFDAGGSYYDCSTTKWGCWTATKLVAHASFIGAGGYNTTATRYDFAFGVVGAGGASSTQLDATVGSFPIAFNTVSSGAQMYAFGYPAAAPYNGTDLIYCAGKVSADILNASKTWGMTCNMTGGASGGPWFYNFSEATGSGTLGSLNSYRYSFGNKMYGPKFTSTTQDVYTEARGGGDLTTVITHPM